MRSLIKVFFSLVLILGMTQAHAGVGDYVGDRVNFAATEIGNIANGMTSAWNAVNTIPTSTQVAESAAAEAGAFFTNLEGIALVAAGKFTAAVTASMYSSGMAVASGLKTSALSLAGALALMYFFIDLVMNLGKSNSRPLFEMLFEVGVPCMVAGMLINGFPSYMDSFRTLLNIFANVGTDPITGMIDFFASALKMIKIAITNVYTNMKAASILSTQMLAVAADGLAVLLMCIPILFLVVVGLAEVFGLIILGPFLLAIGVAFGPLMIAGMVTPWTRPWFTSWLYFILGSAMVTGVTRVGLMIAGGLFSALNMQSLVTPAPAAATLGLGVVVLLAVNGLIQQIPGIASAMIPGSIGAKSPTDSMVRGGKTAAGTNRTARALGGKAGRAATAPFSVAGEMRKRANGNIKAAIDRYKASTP